LASEVTNRSWEAACRGIELQLSDNGRIAHVPRGVVSWFLRTGGGRHDHTLFLISGDRVLKGKKKATQSRVAHEQLVLESAIADPLQVNLTSSNLQGVRFWFARRNKVLFLRIAIGLHYLSRRDGQLTR
jgi:hypothetical protein